MCSVCSRNMAVSYPHSRNSHKASEVWARLGSQLDVTQLLPTLKPPPALGTLPVSSYAALNCFHRKVRPKVLRAVLTNRVNWATVSEFLEHSCWSHFIPYIRVPFSTTGKAPSRNYGLLRQLCLNKTVSGENKCYFTF